jgi:signal transduction histidine kinase
MEPHFEKGPSLAWEVRDEDPEVLGEEQALVQVAVNLLLNAREAAEQRGGEGLVRVRLEPAKDGARLTVEDNGPGIPPEIRDRLFEPFVTSKAGGSGLGLFVVETLIRRMGGQVTLAQRPGGGTVASVTLPSPEGA